VRERIRSDSNSAIREHPEEHFADRVPRVVNALPPMLSLIPLPARS